MEEKALSEAPAAIFVLFYCRLPAARCLLFPSFLGGTMSEPSPARKPWWRRWFGSRSERAAARFLKQKGCRILARNYSCSLGELDLVALDNGSLVFVEVRSTGNEDLTRPALSVDFNKQKRLTKLALHFLQAKRLLDHAARFDVIAVSWPADRRKPVIEHYANAFEAVGRGQMYN